MEYIVILCRKLYTTIASLKREAFQRWHGKLAVFNLSNVLKKQQSLVPAYKLVEVIVALYDDARRSALISLRRHKVEANIKRRFINALCKTTMGSLHVSFQKWRNLPSKRLLQRQDSIAVIKQRMLNIQLIYKKFAFEKMKEIIIRDAQIKRDCVKKMILLTTNRSKLYFQRWAKNSNHMKHIIACRHTLNLFDTLNSGIEGSLAFLTTDAGTLNKKRAILR